MDTIKEYNFITDTNNIFSHIFKHFYEDYVECLFELEKLKLSIKDISNLMKKSDTIDKLNEWIKICYK
jgi:GTP1/Obg family GTP-binding protein